MLYKTFAKPILFRMDPERAHHLTIGGLRVASRIPGMLQLFRAAYGSPKAPELRQTLWGIQYDNPIGLAAGLDKNGEAAAAFSAMGFGFVETGTVTPKGQPGNERPRLFRLPEDEALINRMGFNNHGAEYMRELLARLSHRPVPIAVNIGKNKVTPNEHAVQDYRTCLRILYDVGDFFVVNISSPNTPDLRSLQHGEHLQQLLHGIIEERDLQAKQRGATTLKPVLVKLAPDLSQEELEESVKIIEDARISGIIATNTTISRDGLTHPNAKQSGGLSGRPLKDTSTAFIRSIYRLTGGRIPIVGCGGVFSSADAYEKIRAGASLVEIYTALIYQGPGLMKSINKGLLEYLRKDGFSHISEAVGKDV